MPLVLCTVTPALCHGFAVTGPSRKPSKMPQTRLSLNSPAAMTQVMTQFHFVVLVADRLRAINCVSGRCVAEVGVTLSCCC